MFTHSITITFCPPFWIALFEIYNNGLYSVAREIIGTSEPKGADIKLFFWTLDYNRLQYTKDIEGNNDAEIHKSSFKKLQKKIKQETTQIEFKFTFTKAQIELKKQQNEKKATNKRQLKENREILEEKKFELKQIKRKEKHRGH
jgi:hypothetical protein